MPDSSHKGELLRIPILKGDQASYSSFSWQQDDIEDSSYLMIDSLFRNFS